MGGTKGVGKKTVNRVGEWEVRKKGGGNANTGKSEYCGGGGG